MATNPEEQHEKEGICVADVVKCAVLAWSATLLTISYLGIYPPDEDGQHVRRFAAYWRDGIVWHRTQVQWQWKQEADYC